MADTNTYTLEQIKAAKQLGQDLVAGQPEVSCLGCKIGLGILITPLWAVGMTLGAIAVPVVAILVAFGGISEQQAEEIVQEFASVSNLKQVLTDLCTALGDC